MSKKNNNSNKCIYNGRKIMVSYLAADSMSMVARIVLR